MKPVIINYYITYRCNARCPFCTIWQDDTVKKVDEAQLETIRTNLSDARRRGAKLVDFTGGESLLHDDLPGALAHAKKTGLRTTVTSNGIRYPDRAKELAGLIDFLQFSLHGPDSTTHDEITGTPSFTRVMESIETARSLGERPAFIHTVTDDNLVRVPGVISLARSLKIPLFLNPCFTYPGTEGMTRRGIEALSALAKGPGVTVDRGYLKFVADGGNNTSDPRCLAASSTIVISPDNHLILPCFHYRRKSIPINGDLYELLDSGEAVKAVAHQGKYPFCEGCTVYCYMRASLYRRLDRYFLPSILSGGKYLYELYRPR